MSESWTGRGTDGCIVYSYGLAYASVCTDLSDEETAERLNRSHPTGIGSRWVIAEEPFADGSANPHPCERDPGRRHVLFHC